MELVFVILPSMGYVNKILKSEYNLKTIKVRKFVCQKSRLWLHLILFTSLILVAKSSRETIYEPRVFLTSTLASNEMHSIILVHAFRFYSVFTLSVLMRGQVVRIGL